WLHPDYRSILVLKMVKYLAMGRCELAPTFLSTCNEQRACTRHRVPINGLLGPIYRFQDCSDNPAMPIVLDTSLSIPIRTYMPRKAYYVCYSQHCTIRVGN